MILSALLRFVVALLAAGAHSGSIGDHGAAIELLRTLWLPAILKLS
jgi:hypothetical protein